MPKQPRRCLHSLRRRPRKRCRRNPFYPSSRRKQKPRHPNRNRKFPPRKRRKTMPYSLRKPPRPIRCLMTNTPPKSPLRSLRPHKNKPSGRPLFPFRRPRLQRRKTCQKTKGTKNRFYASNAKFSRNQTPRPRLQSLCRRSRPFRLHRSSRTLPQPSSLRPPKKKSTIPLFYGAGAPRAPFWKKHGPLTIPLSFRCPN